MKHIEKVEGSAITREAIDEGVNQMNSAATYEERAQIAENRLQRIEADVQRYQWLRINFSELYFKNLHVKNGDAPEKLDALIDELRG